MQKISFFLGILILLFVSACRMDFDTIPSQGRLEFSKDTVYLNTVFTNIGSGTYRLKVYNRTDHAVKIPTISLGKGSDSGYRLNVDGISGQYFEEVEILAKDSIFVFIETTIDYDEVSDPLYVDDLQFDSGINQQVVKLVTLVQDAHFLFPDKADGVIETLTLDGEETEIKGRFLTDDELTFTNDKPYVIYGFMAVGDSQNSPKTLTIEAGANVYFHADSGLIVNPNSSLHILGSLNVEGQPQTEVILQGDRLEPDFENTPGQWGFIYLRSGSVDNKIEYATVKNAKIGIFTEGISTGETPSLRLQNSKFFNHSLVGVLARHSQIEGYNVVINNCGWSGFVGMLGGTYHFTHSTFANYWNGVRSTPSVWLSNKNVIKFDKEEPDYVADFQVRFTNCIIYGTNNIELRQDKSEEAAFDYIFVNNLLKFNDIGNSYAANPLYNFNDPTHFTGTILNESPDFKPEWIKENKLLIGQNSAGKGKASIPGTALVPLDILGKTRSNPADIGAYEHIVFE